MRKLIKKMCACEEIGCTVLSHSSEEPDFMMLPTCGKFIDSREGAFTCTQRVGHEGPHIGCCNSNREAMAMHGIWED